MIPSSAKCSFPLASTHAPPCGSSEQPRAQDSGVGPTTVTELLGELQNLMAVVMKIDSANQWLRPRLQRILSGKLSDSSGLPDLLAALTKHGWDVEEQAFAPAQRSLSHIKEQAPAPGQRTLNLVEFISDLQLWLYVRMNRIGNGAYAVVYKARNRETSEVLAMKKLIHTADALASGFPDAVVREISILREMRHTNVVQLKDMILSGSCVYLVLECLDCDLRTYLDKHDVVPDVTSIKSIMLQIVAGIEYVHANLVLHRDLKPENVLVNVGMPQMPRGDPQGLGTRSASGPSQDDGSVVVKLADFGLARQYLPPEQEYTGRVVTLYYRAPELLLGFRCYSTAVDIWSVGCIMAELFNLVPIFRADSELGVLKKIFETFGTPTREQWPEFHRGNREVHWAISAAMDLKTVCPRLADDPEGLDLLSRLLAFDPGQRITARQAHSHPWFSSLLRAGELEA